ncbi:MAG: GNAT family N-acetyltransferase [Anaerolineales bacterium]
MQITIREIDENSIQHVDQCDSSFTIHSKLVLSAENGRISYTVLDIPPYGKQYQPDEVDYSEYISNPDKTIFLAYVDNEPAGQIRIRKYWNGYAYIDDFAVDAQHRRHGIGGALMQRAMEWAKDKGFPGIMLETQNNNVAACRFYESCGFELGGFDVYLYKGLNRATDEIALYWYLMFE